MNSMIRMLLSSKGLYISEEDDEELAKEWAALNTLRRGFEKTIAGEDDIVLKYVPGVSTFD
ncbi:hypothetical protein [Alicyclobacillus sp. SO9]|uniref:hypothetical protein n=1 Tax=Alicyclobacillus sp. SO9 TaxID=2665646 RepID=UPI0018E7ACDE|nr:hypothetical protein [Alicyclobacillus sp. SO9]QQE79194.1 hypothetical protein GI364_01360 [Alicyclobacillus sp. SO9]